MSEASDYHLKHIIHQLYAETSDCHFKNILHQLEEVISKEGYQATETVLKQHPQLYSGHSLATYLLQKVVEAHDLILIQFLLEAGANPNAITPQRNLPILFTAINYDDASVLELLLEHGGDESLTFSIWSLIEFCIHEYANECLSLLLERGVDPCGIQAVSGSNALGVAVRMNNVKAAQLLMPFGVELNYQDKKGSTPIMMALFAGHEDMIQSLLFYHPDLDLKDHDGLSVWDRLKEPSYQSYAPLFAHEVALKESSLLDQATPISTPRLKTKAL